MTTEMNFVLILSCFNFYLFKDLSDNRAWHLDHLSRQKYFTMFSSQVSENIFLSLKIFLFEQWFAPGLVGGRAGQGSQSALNKIYLSMFTAKMECNTTYSRYSQIQFEQDKEKQSIFSIHIFNFFLVSRDYIYV